MSADDAQVYLKLVETGTKSGSLEQMLVALDSIKAALGNHHRRAMAEIFRPEGAACGKAHEAVLGLSVPALSTANYDQLLELSERRLGRPQISKADIPGAPLALWSSCQRAAHGRLVPFFRGAGDDLLDTVYVELAYLYYALSEMGRVPEREGRVVF